MEQLYIPKKIKVGYKKREDTYTNKLGYVVYYDERGNLRKETSFNNWRDKKLGTDEYENVPTSGFVLNKNVGGYSYWSWHSRRAKIRVYDPRGYEIEITLENLLYILQYRSSIIGKGLEGEFVYSWDGKNHVLLPTDTPEYRSSMQYTKLQSKKVTKKDMYEGWVYKTKENRDVIYLGRIEFLAKINSIIGKQKRHIFTYKGDNDKWLFLYERGFTHLAEIVDTEVAYDFSEARVAFADNHIEIDIKDFEFNETELKYDEKDIDFKNLRLTTSKLNEKNEVWSYFSFDNILCMSYYYFNYNFARASYRNTIYLEKRYQIEFKQNDFSQGKYYYTRKEKLANFDEQSIKRIKDLKIYNISVILSDNTTLTLSQFLDKIKYL